MLRSLLDLKPRDVPVRVALRNTAAVMAPLAIGVVIDQIPAALAVTTGALNTMFTDLPGPYRQRMQRMLMAALAAGLSALAGIAIGAHTAVLVATATAVGFAGGMLVALGPVAARVGLTSMIVLLITASLGVPLRHAPGVAALVLLGGLLQMALALAAWPLQRFRPERFALAALLRQLADVARTRPDASLPPPASFVASDTLRLLHGSHRARGVAMQSFRIIAELAERARIDLLALVDLPARFVDDAVRESIIDLLSESERVLVALAQALESAARPTLADLPLDALQTCVERLISLDGNTVAVRDRRLLRIAVARAQGLAGQLRSMARNGEWASSAGELRADLAEARLPAALRAGNPMRTLRANWSLSSIAMRHALRCAVCLGVAVVIARGLAIEHGVWIPMTAAIVLKPDFGGTLRFGALRVAGTFAGLLLTTVIAHYAMDGVVLRLLLMTLLCVGFRLFAQVNYGIGVALLTGMLVLLLSFEGIAPANAIRMRVVATVLGCGLALAAYAAWPTWEGRRINIALARLIDAYRRHIAAVLHREVAELANTRNAARMARTAMMASMDRLRAEPGGLRARRNREHIERLLANAHRLVRASVSLEAVLRDGHPLPDPPELDTFALTLDAALVDIVSALDNDIAVPPLSLRATERALVNALERQGAIDAGSEALADTCDRFADIVDTLAHQLRGTSSVRSTAPSGAAG